MFYYIGIGREIRFVVFRILVVGFLGIIGFFVGWFV